VSPVLEAGQQTKMIYFPKNSNWYDLVTGEKYSGGKDHEVKLHQEYIPVFVRSGAFIPMIDVLQTTDDYNLDHLKLHYYFDDEIIESSGYLYNDDGKTPKAFEKGKYEILRFKSKVQNRELKIETESENGKQFKPGRREISLIIHNITKEPKAIPGYKYRWDSEKNLLTISVRFTGKKQIINIKF
jgi:alpha-glucosidase (family GH31 glycosyl hydrolase)